MQFLKYIALAFSISLFSGVHAEEIKIPFKNLTLNGELVLADGKKITDGVILMTHGTMGHNKMEIMSSLQESLKERGLNTLAITLSLAENNRHGMYECSSNHRHKHDDAVTEIEAWVNWLKNQEVGTIVLLGHSRGGNQTTLFAAHNNSSEVRAVVLLAPALLEDPMESRENKHLHKNIQKAESILKSKKSNSMLKNIPFLTCPQANVTPSSYLSYYSKKNIRSTSTLLKKIKKPVLIIAGSEDTIVPNLISKIKPSLNEKTMEGTVIDGADHFFRGLFVDEVADRIETFLGKI